MVNRKIPKNKSELELCVIGDWILTSIDGTSCNWLVYGGNKECKNKEIVHEFLDQLIHSHQIFGYKINRKYLQFDENKGVVIPRRYRELTLYDHLIFGYESRIIILKQANKWRDD